MLQPIKVEVTRTFCGFQHIDLLIRTVSREQGCRAIGQMCHLYIPERIAPSIGSRKNENPERAKQPCDNHPARCCPECQQNTNHTNSVEEINSLDAYTAEDEQPNHPQR